MRAAIHGRAMLVFVCVHCCHAAPASRKADPHKSGTCWLQPLPPPVGPSLARERVYIYKLLPMQQR
ncbi:hypothetical protein BOTBODRAFT_346789 [Botryobasidium botryosum FD-172 SS1]|uniref:Secreted protein n=1 Tax=Botryobasidium botryosum (strain FD-172 SS1) TaxID=930990 RepID=A0A067M102_BOTB1|nr:hypothetical protein BOTBODRAFT_346789 [Botryobasidium botryosum FD-172 SS1]